MSIAIAADRWRTTLAAVFFLTMAFALLVAAQPAPAAEVLEEDKPMGEEPKAVDQGERSEKVVVVPEPPVPPHWSGWSDRHPGQHRSAPRIKVWVDRGEWSTYYPGERLWVYFRVDRPCYVTILDYSPDGRVSTIYPSRWSGSTFVHPGRTYRVPESRRYSLRIAGAGGVETLVACAHETPWPSGPCGGAWIPRRHPHRGRVVVGRPGGSPPPGWRGRVVIGPRHWPVPPQWHDRPELWSCDSVSFYVAGDGWHGEWHGDYWRDQDHGSWRDDDWDHRYGDTYWRHYDGEEDGDWEWEHGGGRTIVHDRFKMKNCKNDYSRGFDVGSTDATLLISCVESSKGDPTEIVGRFSMDEYWGDDVLFRIDVEGDHGVRPQRGRVFVRHWGRTRVEVEITDFSMSSVKRWQVPRLKWVEFDVRVFRA
jgi:hypothetical protein